MYANRRAFLATAAVALGSAACTTYSGAQEQTSPDRAIPMIHVTDLFRPHDDPDDHWDLACVYALAFQGHVDLRGILIDYPKPERPNDPDVLSVSQMNYLTGKAVPVMVGSPEWIEPEDAVRPVHASALRGIRALLDMLRRSPEPVVINILGSCRDVAIAGRLEPELFAAKCRAIYLNAGSGTPDKSKAARLEWNVQLDPVAYAAIFDIPCPIYWMPCFEVLRPTAAEVEQFAGYATFYRFRQGDVLPHLSQGTRNFFAYMFRHGRSETKHTTAEDLRPNWLRYLVDEPEPQLLDRIDAMDRNMWCTGGFLHAAGMTVTPGGVIVPLADADEPVFTFDPICVTCAADGVTGWQDASTETDRFIFHVRDRQRYAAAMTTAMRSLLSHLP